MYQRLKKIVIIGSLLIFAMSAGLYVLMLNSSEDTVLEPRLTTVRVGVANAGGEFSSVVIVADSQGYFEDEGLNVILTKEVSGVVALDSLQMGSVDIVTASDFAFVNNSFSDTSSKIIATIDAADGVEVVARRDSGISTPDDLIGKKIGVVPQTAAEFVLVRFLIINDLSLTDLNIVNLTYTETEKAIVNGAVDAVIINNPFAYNISKTLGANGISWMAQYGQPLLFNAISSDSFINSNPQTVESFLKALVKAEQFIELNPDQAKQAVQESFSFTEDYINQLWDNHVFRVRLDQSLLSILEAQARWVLLNKNNGNTSVPNYFPQIYVSGLETIAPEAVTIIR